MTPPRTLLLGLGNDILTDDRVGLLTARRVAELVGDLADHVEAAIATIDLVSLISGYRRVVVIDAFVDEHLPPGATVRCTPEDLPSGFGYRSFHTMPFREMLRLGRTVEMDVPDEVIIHGMVVGDAATFGSEPTPEVAAAWPRWAEEIAATEFGV